MAAWTEDMFIEAIREGKHMGVSRPILPPMPWPVYRNFTDDDLKALFAYLKSIPPISNHVPDPIIAEAPAAGKQYADVVTRVRSVEDRDRSCR